MNLKTVAPARHGVLRRGRFGLPDCFIGIKLMLIFTVMRIRPADAPPIGDIYMAIPLLGLGLAWLHHSDRFHNIPSLKTGVRETRYRVCTTVIGTEPASQ